MRVTMHDDDSPLPTKAHAGTPANVDGNSGRGGDVVGPMLGEAIEVLPEDTDGAPLGAHSIAPPATPGKSPKNGRKRFIKSLVTVHDRTQIETVFDYYLYRGNKADSGPDAIQYRVEAFLFYPRQFGLDAETYPKERFYSDIRPLIRFREPRLGTKQMLGKKAAVESPLLYLQKYVEALAQGRLNDPVTRAVDETRVFACAYISGYLKNIDRRRKRIAELKGACELDAASEIFDKTAKVMEKANAVLVEFRKILTAASALPDDLGAELKLELKLVDEYCYYRLRDGIAYLSLMTEELRRARREPDVVRFMATMTDLLAVLDGDAAAKRYMVIRPDSSRAEKERFVRRRGELKRRIWGVLYLDIRTQPLFAVQRQLGAMIAAGLAAFWAVIAQVLMLKKFVIGGNASSLVGLSGLIFTSAGVLAYIIKDRIKDVGRSYFRSGLFREVPDQSERIYYRPSGRKPVVIGSIKEVAHFRPLDRLPPYIAELRENHYGKALSDAEAVDAVLHYKKTISLSRGIKILDRYPLRAVHDILRLNIDACLPRLGEPTRQLNVVDAAGDVHQVEFPKIYYLDLALSYSKIQAAGTAVARTTDYFRLVLDKNGLLRIERLS